MQSSEENSERKVPNKKENSNDKTPQTNGKQLSDIHVPTMPTNSVDVLPDIMYLFLRFVIYILTGGSKTIYLNSLALCIRIIIDFMLFTGYFVVLTRWDNQSSIHETGLRYAIMFSLILYLTLGHTFTLKLIKNILELKEEQKQKSKEEPKQELKEEQKQESKEEPKQESKEEPEQKKNFFEYGYLIVILIIHKFINIVLNSIILAYCISISERFADNLPFTADWSNLMSINESITWIVSLVVFICLLLDIVQLILSCTCLAKYVNTKSKFHVS